MAASNRRIPRLLPVSQLVPGLLLALGGWVAGGWLPALHGSQCLGLGLVLIWPAVVLALLAVGPRVGDLKLLPLLLLPAIGAHGLEGLLLVPLGVALLLRDPRLRFDGAAFSLTGFSSLFISSPSFQWASDGFSVWLSGLLGSLADHPLEWGDSTGPSLLLVYLGVRALAGWATGTPRTLTAWLLASGLALFALAGWVRSWDMAPALIGVAPVMAIALVCLLLEQLVHGPQDGPERTPTPTSPSVRRLIGPGAACAVVLGLAVVIHGALPFTRPSLEGVKVAFREEGDWSWESTREGTRPGPRMGGLLEVLRRWGATVDILPDERLQAEGAGYDLVFVIHPTEPIPPALHRALMEGVEKGGALVVVGEHTDVNGIRNGVNSVLRETSIRLKDDSAIPAWRGWNWNFVQRTLLSPVTRGMENAHRFGISIGGSLETKAPAQPLVLGTIAFSDTGNPDNPRGKMGDNRYGFDERFGSVVVAATQARGKGVICAIGDTSGLMSLSTPQVWPFYLDLARGLLARPLFGRSLVWPLLGLGLLLGGCVLLLREGRPRLLVLATGLCLLVTVAAVFARRPGPPVVQESRGICWIDYSHQNSFHFASSMDWSVSSLLESCYNAGRLPLFLWDFDVRQLQQAQWLLVNGSTRRWSAKEARELKDWVEQGGRLVVAGDYRRKAALEPLLGEFGLDFGDTPLGTAPESLNRMGQPAEFQFYEAWPILCSTGDLDTLVSCWGYPVVGMRAVGKGVVSVIGDERLLTKWGLEGAQRNGRPLNTARRFLDAMQPQAPPPPVPPGKQAWLAQYRDSLRFVPTPGPEMPVDRLPRRQQLIHGLLGLPQPVMRAPGGFRPGMGLPGGGQPGMQGSGSFRPVPGPQGPLMPGAVLPAVPRPGLMGGRGMAVPQQSAPGVTPAPVDPKRPQGPPPRRVTPLRQPDRPGQPAQPAQPAGGQGK